MGRRRVAQGTRALSQHQDRRARPQRRLPQVGRAVPHLTRGPGEC